MSSSKVVLRVYELNCMKFGQDSEHSLMHNKFALDFR